jgi:hypothetical protein
MTEEARLDQAFQLTDLVDTLFKQGLRERFPDLPEDQLHKLFLKRLDKCHNENY